MEGNQMKMRGALLLVGDALDTISAHEDDIEFVRTWIRLTKGAVQEALSAPPRNCDIGTVEEQFERWRTFCDKYDDDCTGCPCDGYTCTLAYCFSKWAQMPYEEQEGGEKHGKV